jgi:hypothetical protein
MLTGGRVVAAAGSQGDLPQFEVGQELVPLGGGELAVECDSRKWPHLGA